MTEEQMQRGPDPAQQAESPWEARDGLVTVSLLSEGETAPESLPCTPALALLLERAARINRSYEADFDISFSSMLLAFLASDDPLSRWFQRYVNKAGIDVTALLERWKLDEATLGNIGAQLIAEEDLLRSYRQTSSARSLLHAAQELHATV